MEERDFILIQKSLESRDGVKIIIGIKDRATTKKKLFDFLINLEPGAFGELLGCESLLEALVTLRQAQCRAEANNSQTNGYRAVRNAPSSLARRHLYWRNSPRYRKEWNEGADQQKTKNI